jgi:hypothetical protein
MFRAKLLLLFGLIPACGGCNNLSHQKITLDKDTVITLQRTACYRGCSPYKVMINADGTVVFDGSKYVYDAKTGKEAFQPLGTQKSSISREQLQLLVSEFDRINYFALKDQYTEKKDCPEYGTDAPSASTSIQTNGKSKSIKHYGGCMGTDALRDLSALEAKIDEIANTKQWLK